MYGAGSVRRRDSTGLPRMRSDGRGRAIIVGFEYLEASQLLIEDGEWLKLLRSCHLLFEPSLDLILLHLFKIGVIIVDVSGDRSGNVWEAAVKSC